MSSLRGGSGRADTRRLCVYCGFDGLSIQAGGDIVDFRCPACRGDLYSRPPRNYLEMEGFVAIAPSGPSPAGGWRGLVSRVMRAWTRAICWCRCRRAGDFSPLGTSDSSSTRAPRIHDQRGSRRRMTGLRDEGSN